MRGKLLSVIFCMLIVIASLIPVTGRVELQGTDGENTQTTTEWIPLPIPQQVDMLLERSICRRMSFHTSYPSTPVSDADLSTILWAAYGLTTDGGRTVYSPNGTYATTIYIIRSDATYLYVPANHSLHLWKTGNYLNLGQATNAPIKLGLVWNMSIAPDEKAGMAEIGMIAQNVYFDANALNLATITTGMSVGDLYNLDLPSNEKPEIIMHLGHPPTAYSFTYEPLSSSTLPSVMNNTLTLADAINSRKIANEWIDTGLPLLEQSQMLWASYGTSYLKDNINNRHHRTLPSAINIYPFKVYMANQTGVYQYAPTTHSIAMITSGDKRVLIQNAVNPSNISVSTAPMLIIPVWDKNVGSQTYLSWWWYESGAIIHNILLEAAALNLSGNVLSVITDQNSLRSALGLSSQTNLVCFHVAMAGHTNGSSQNSPPLPPSISGPSTGFNAIQYNYSIVTTDPDTDDVYYWVDWGDGSGGGWIGPFASGANIICNHTWSMAGTYTIKAKAKDGSGSESSWTPFQMMIAGPDLSLDIKGGLGITVSINNTGTIDATNISWKITLAGGFVIPAQKTGNIPSILKGNQEKIQMIPFGLGKKTIAVFVTADNGIVKEITANGLLLFFFIIAVK